MYGTWILIQTSGMCRYAYAELLVIKQFSWPIWISTAKEAKIQLQQCRQRLVNPFCYVNLSDLCCVRCNGDNKVVTASLSISACIHAFVCATNKNSNILRNWCSSGLSVLTLVGQLKQPKFWMTTSMQVQCIKYCFFPFILFTFCIRTQC